MVTVQRSCIIKALGITLSSLHKIELDTRRDCFIENSKKWFLKDLDFGPSFFGALCSEVEIESVQLQMVKYNLKDEI